MFSDRDSYYQEAYETRISLINSCRDDPIRWQWHIQIALARLEWMYTTSINSGQGARNFIQAFGSYFDAPPGIPLQDSCVRRAVISQSLGSVALGQLLQGIGPQQGWSSRV
jgi:hypothetical protein